MKINGLIVKDADKNLNITISPTDVKKGVNKNPSSCAAALALKRKLHCTDARVHIGRTYVKFKDHWVRYHTPRSLRSEIIAFDRGGSFDPGEYVLLKIQPSHKLGKRQGSDKPTKHRIKRAKPHHVSGIRPSGANR